MAALQTRRGRGELQQQTYDLVLAEAREKRWTENKQAYPTVRRKLGLAKSRVYSPAVRESIARALADALLAPVPHQQNGNGAVHHAEPKAEAIDDALTMAQRVIIRDASYIAVLEAVIEARHPDLFKHLRAVREAIQ